MEHGTYIAPPGEVEGNEERVGGGAIRLIKSAWADCNLEGVQILTSNDL